MADDRYETLLANGGVRSSSPVSELRGRVVPDQRRRFFAVSGRLWAVLAGQLINAPTVGCNYSLNPSGYRTTALAGSVHLMNALPTSSKN
jgi:hypothetical protein